MLSVIFSLNTLWWLILLLYIPACFGLIIIVLLQKGKGQGLSGAFGMGGGMDTIFGPRSSKSLPQKITYASAGVFMTLALVMSILSGKVGRSAAPDLIDEPVEASFDALFDPEQPGDDVISIPVDGPDPVQIDATELPDAPIALPDIEVDVPAPVEPDEAAAPEEDALPEDDAPPATLLDELTGDDAAETPDAAAETESPEAPVEVISIGAPEEAPDADSSEE